MIRLPFFATELRQSEECAEEPWSSSKIEVRGANHESGLHHSHAMKASFSFVVLAPLYGGISRRLRYMTLGIRLSQQSNKREQQSKTIPKMSWQYGRAVAVISQYNCTLKNLFRKSADLPGVDAISTAFAGTDDPDVRRNFANTAEMS
ncbi:hypothetical protein IF2G_06084 [Cordyceps javanica]|nr:hypothetical protein IF2G_06084 [Cordyceps javanica]